MPTAIQVDRLTKTFLVPERQAGLRASLASLVHRRMREVRAVDCISFDIAPGEIVGFLGPNGAGKTTTLKMLSGVLYPTAGQVTVLGHIPSRREKDFLRQITFVVGQRNSMTWDLPAADSFDLTRSIYDLPLAEFRRTRDELLEQMELRDLVSRPIRNLSLGERMKMEFVNALLHRPSILFLDEPTIGLDVTMQRRLRDLVAEYNRRTGATVLLTSHYMADVQALCPRVIVIHHGGILFDGSLASLVDRFSEYKTIVVTLPEPFPDLSGYGEVVASAPGRVTLRVAKREARSATARLLAQVDVDDLSVQEPAIETVIERVFAQKALPEAAR